jgi:vacuolar-type H+-ATPase subunit E/Vma4
MSLEKVVEDILERGKREASRIIQKAEKEASELRREAEMRAEEIRREKEKETERMIREIRKREIPSAELEAKKLILDTEKRALDKVYQEVLRKLSSLPRERNERILHKILRIVGKSEKIYCRDEDKEVILKEGLDFGGAISCAGGILVESSDYTIDYRYETILEREWGSLVRKVHGLLFQK